MPGNLNIQFLDVGQGDGIFITFPNRKTMLVDLGSTKNKKLTKTDFYKYFAEHTIFSEEGKVLDYLVLTHGDLDHYNFVEKFVTDFKITVANLIYGGLQSDYKKVISGLKESHTKRGQPINVVIPTFVFPFDLNSREFFGGVHVQVLAMDVPGTSNSSDAWRKNTASVVMRLEYSEESVILSGDATIDTERFILTTMEQADNLPALRSTVLKVGHHGSARTSIAPAWIEAIKPEYVFISSDRSGSLSEKEKTGHRLPQLLTLDIIEKKTRLRETGEPHTYVCSYNPDDYTEYRNPNTGEVGFENNHKKEAWGGRRTWVQFNNKKGIFTTLAAMDLRSADASEADQGAQYELNISDEGAVNIRTTLDT